MIENTNGDLFKPFEQVYIDIRQKEGRILTQDEIIRLPYASEDNTNANEWKRRIRSTKRLLSYLDKKNPATVLDLACGNGWLTHKLSKIVKHVYGLDVNITELRQAEQLLANENVSLIYGDVFTWKPSEKIDLIIINASIQYFKDVTKLLHCLNKVLSPTGEIHILDSPFYHSKDAALAAKKRSLGYFEQYGTVGMSDYYHHHQWAELQEFRYDVLYNPHLFINRLKRKLSMHESPFPWIRIKN